MEFYWTSKLTIFQPSGLETNMSSGPSNSFVNFSIARICQWESIQARSIKKVSIRDSSWILHSFIFTIMSTFSLSCFSLILKLCKTSTRTQTTQEYDCSGNLNKLYHIFLVVNNEFHNFPWKPENFPVFSGMFRNTQYTLATASASGGTWNLNMNWYQQLSNYITIFMAEFPQDFWMPNLKIRLF